VRSGRCLRRAGDVHQGRQDPPRTLQLFDDPVELLGHQHDSPFCIHHLLGALERGLDHERAERLVLGASGCAKQVVGFRFDPKVDAL
jgi:hypothetical protein